MKMIAIMVLLFCFEVSAHASDKVASQCPSSIKLEITRHDGNTVFRFQKKDYDKYPLDPVGEMGALCPQKRMYILVDSTVPFDDVVTALDGSGKDQIEKVSIF